MMNLVTSIDVVFVGDDVHAPQRWTEFRPQIASGKWQDYAKKQGWQLITLDEKTTIVDARTEELVRKRSRTIDLLERLLPNGSATVAVRALPGNVRSELERAIGSEGRIDPDGTVSLKGNVRWNLVSVDQSSVAWTAEVPEDAKSWRKSREQLLNKPAVRAVPYSARPASSRDTTPKPMSGLHGKFLSSADHPSHPPLDSQRAALVWTRLAEVDAEASAELAARTYDAISKLTAAGVLLGDASLASARSFGDLPVDLRKRSRRALEAEQAAFGGPDGYRSFLNQAQIRDLRIVLDVSVGIAGGPNPRVLTIEIG
jgi:hypothetical protein